MPLWNLLGPVGDMYCFSNTYSMLVFAKTCSFDFIVCQEQPKMKRLVLMINIFCRLSSCLKTLNASDSTKRHMHFLQSAILYLAGNAIIHSDRIHNIGHMLVSGIEPSSVSLSQEYWNMKLNNLEEIVCRTHTFTINLVLKTENLYALETLQINRSRS